MIIFDRVTKREIQRSRSEWQVLTILSLILLISPLNMIVIPLWVLFTLSYLWRELCYLFHGEK